MMRERSAASGVAREALLLLITCAAGALLVACLVFLPLLFERNGAPSQRNLGRYAAAVGGYLGGLAQGNLGANARGRPVTDEVLQAARRTLELLAVSMAVAVPLGVIWGGLLAAARGAAGALLFGLSTLLLSLPSFVAMLLLGEAVAGLTLRTGVRLGFVQGYGLDGHLILPTLVLATRGAAFLARSLQVAQEQIMGQDWIRVARAKGLGGLGLWRRHVLPALRLPILGGALGTLRVVVAGMVIVDYIYNWGGLGRKLLQVTSGGVVSAASTGAAAGAAIVLLLIFVGVDALGRLALRGASGELRAD
jgi:ABC-type dipeptide/oligopeptide/nickel transport system permease component